jgi:hypothetical protein
MENLGVAEWEILKNIPIGALVVEKSRGKIIFVNDHFIELIGFNPKGHFFKEFALNIVSARKLDGSPYLYEQLPLTEAILDGKATSTKR